VAREITRIATVANLVDRLAKLPGIGRKSAQRVALHLLRRPDDAEVLAGAIRALKEKVRYCVLRGLRGPGGR
jgi:recombination protein RecR